MAASDTPVSPSPSNSRENTSPRVPAPENTQLSTPNGDPTNVSSVAMDRGLLDLGLPSFAGVRPSPPASMANSAASSPAVSDVYIMLLVKTGDDSPFTCQMTI